MQSFYQHYYKKYIQALQNAADKADRYVVLQCTVWFVMCLFCDVISSEFVFLLSGHS
jgi:hypothetical protein